MEEKREGGRERKGEEERNNAFEFDKHIQEFDYFFAFMQVALNF